jgi:hypothetical protein
MPTYIHILDLARSSCEAMVGVYKKKGFQRPWLDYWEWSLAKTEKA